MNRHSLYPICICFVGILVFSSCGNDSKTKAISNSNTAIDALERKDSITDINADSSALTASAINSAMSEEETAVEIVEQSFNPPHIPVFKKEKVRENKGSSEQLPKNHIDKKTNNSVVDQNPTEIVKTTKSKEASSKVNTSKGKDTEIVWRRNFYSFGDITQGDTVYFKFEFTNIGDHPLEIESATASCGCTHPSFSFVPTESNEKGEIKGMYISDDTKKGNETAMILVKANTDPQIHKLYIGGNVLLPEGNSKDPEIEETKGD